MDWNLDDLYTSFTDPRMIADKQRLKELIASFEEYGKNIEQYSDQEVLQAYVDYQSEYMDKMYILESYASLILSVDTTNQEALTSMNELEALEVLWVEPTVIVEKRIASIPDLSACIKKAELEEYTFCFEQIRKGQEHILSQREEMIIAKMQNSGSNAFAKLKDQLIGNHLVDYEGEEVPLTVILNKAYSKSEYERKTAYEAEIASYAKIEQSVAACLNGIKKEAQTISELRGYDSVLDQTLEQSLMSKNTLNSMLMVIQESLPDFRRYLKAKAKHLGHENGLPFYDLYAPVVESNQTYPYEKGCEIVIEQFGKFSKDLSDFASEAIHSHWIDVLPKKGKVGGAFCANLHPIQESRFLLNYGDSFNDVITLGHELGHGFHGACLYNEKTLNASYPMPIAETASTFCETLIQQALLQNASKEEKIAILESELSGCTQVIVDIYSRFLFEQKLFDKEKNGIYTVEEIKSLMVESQKASYGDGLDENYLHPYMWTWKPHYYYANSNYYNFPYAFGLLMAKGLYALYQQKGPLFAKDYEKFLSITGKNTIEDIALSIGIDLSKPDFFRASMQIIIDEIDEFIALLEEED